MAAVKLTITIDESQMLTIRALVEKRRVKSVSAFVQHAISVSLSDVAAWGPLLSEALESTGGELTKEERAWADAVLSTPAPKRRRAA